MGQDMRYQYMHGIRCWNWSILCPPILSRYVFATVQLQGPMLLKYVAIHIMIDHHRGKLKHAVRHRPFSCAYLLQQRMGICETTYLLPKESLPLPWS
jgi:hypothetical protein